MLFQRLRALFLLLLASTHESCCSAAAAGYQVIFNGVRVQALSPTVLRLEPAGPLGFVNSSTFLVVNRTAFAGVPLRTEACNVTHITLVSPFYTVRLQTPSPLLPPPPPAPLPGAPGCSGVQGYSIRGFNGYPPHRISSCGATATSCLAPNATLSHCCNNCSAEMECGAWLYEPTTGWCLLYVAGASLEKGGGDFVAGGLVSPNLGPKTGIAASVTSPDGELLWYTEDLATVDQNLNWPSPMNSTAYAIKDFPRFFVPAWGAAPVPDSEKSRLDPALAHTNGYDFRINSNGDTYVFLLGATLDTWWAARREFVKLTGPTPVLPDYAFGTWFTFWHQYTEAEAKQEVERWHADMLPLDVWGLDMNWRLTSPNQRAHRGDFNDSDYEHPNTTAFPDFVDPGTGWFDWLQTTGAVRTFFNDHPYPRTNCTSPIDGSASFCYQTSEEETAYRWAGLTKWLSRGLTFWWFDANWDFSVPPPNVRYTGPSGGDGRSWCGMDNRVWGSHLYYSIVEQYTKLTPHREHTLGGTDRPMALTKYAARNMQPGLIQHEHPAQHRYPVWWTGDNVPLQGSVESMVDSAVHDFKPYVHSDCGGDYRNPTTGDDLVRWTAHCAFGSIHRFHGAAHQPWSYAAYDRLVPNSTEDTIREYLTMRYKLMPSLIAAGHSATIAGFPLVARCDLYWPEYPDARSNHQYVFLNDTLVAPLWYGDHGGHGDLNRTVWLPPGGWTDAWTGETVIGPRTVNVFSPVYGSRSQIPLWHRHGGLTVLADQPTHNVDSQDWSTLVLDAHLPRLRPSADETLTTTRTVFERGSGARTTLQLHIATVASDGTATARFVIGEAGDMATRAWVVRLHLPTGASADSVFVDGESTHAFDVLSPKELTDKHLPFEGAGGRPPAAAGDIVELRLLASRSARTVELLMD